MSAGLKCIRIFGRWWGKFCSFGWRGEGRSSGTWNFSRGRHRGEDVR
jgi:hypothetical protein